MEGLTMCTVNDMKEGFETALSALMERSKFMFEQSQLGQFDLATDSERLEALTYWAKSANEWAARLNRELEDSYE
jgi:hypothetical protein